MLALLYYCVPVGLVGCMCAVFIIVVNHVIDFGYFG